MIGTLIKRRRLFTALGVAAVVALANPAWAVVTGSGTGGSAMKDGEWAYTPGPAPGTNPICTEIDGTYTSDGWTGTYTIGGKTYAGAVDADHTFVDAIENPASSYQLGDCVVPGASGTVTGSSTLTDTTPPVTGTVTCTFTSGEYRRGLAVPAGADTWRVTLQGSCTDGTTTDSRNETRMGQVYNCTGGPPTSCDSQNDTYTTTV
jgi:hypothetical protein